MKSFIVVICLLVVGCSKQPRSEHLLEQAAKGAPEAPLFKQEVYTNPQNHEKITIISPDELEYLTNGANLICKYAVQGTRLRVIVNAMGTAQALYFEISDEGLQGEKGHFYTETHLAATRLANNPAEIDFSNAKQIALGCKLYATDNDGNFPNDLSELVPSYIPVERVFKSLLNPAYRAPDEFPPLRSDEVDYEYFGAGGKDTDPPSKTLLRSRYTTTDGKRSVVRFDLSGVRE